MRRLSITDWWLCVVMAALMLAGGGFWNEIVRRHHAGKNGQFSRDCRASIHDLCQSMNYVRNCFPKTGQTYLKIKNRPVAPEAARTGSGTSKPVILQGISWQADKPVAFINGNIYQAGEQVGEYTLETIDRNSILISDGAGTITEIKFQEVSP